MIFEKKIFINDPRLKSKKKKINFPSRQTFFESYKENHPMDITLVYTIIGFGLAGYSVIANDSIQTLGTFIASKKKWFAWYILAGSASLVMIFALAWGWYNYDGDISYGRLTRIPYQEIQWYHAVAPAILLLLTINWYSSFDYFFSSVCICFNNCFGKNVSKKYCWLRYCSHSCLHMLDCSFQIYQ